LAYFIPVHFRHPDIQQDQIDGMLFQDGKGSDSIWRRPYLVVFFIPVKEANLTEEDQTRTKTIISNPAPANSLDILKTELKSLSRPLIHKLEEAATYCEVDDIHQIIQQIESPHPDLAGELEHLVKEFDFDGILALIKETR